MSYKVVDPIWDVLKSGSSGLKTAFAFDAGYESAVEERKAHSGQWSGAAEVRNFKGLAA